jgi:hypothetical protein
MLSNDTGETLEEWGCIMWTGTGLGMILNTEGRTRLDIQALDG